MSRFRTPRHRDPRSRVVQKRPLRSVNTASDYRQSLIRALAYGMVNARFTEIARRTDAPFLRASAGESALGRDVETFSVSARVNDGAIEKGLEAIGQELSRLRQYGFGEAELDRAKKDVVASYERAYNERDKEQTGGLASELVRHFLNDEPAPGIVAELDLVRRLIPTITVADAAAVIKDAVRDDNRVVLAVSPSKENLPAVTEAGLRGALGAGARGARRGLARRRCRTRTARHAADARDRAREPRNSRDRRHGPDAFERC